MAVAANVSLKVLATETSSQDLGTAKGVWTWEVAANYATGTSSNQQDLVYQDTRSIAATTSTIDLAGSLTSPIAGTAITMVEVTYICITNKSTTTGEVLSVGAGSNPLLNWVMATGDGVKIGPGGSLVISSPIDGFAVTAGTGDILTLNSGSATISVDILILGRSA